MINTTKEKIDEKPRMLDSLPKLHDRGGGVLRQAARIACLIVVEQYTRLCR